MGNPADAGTAPAGGGASPSGPQLDWASRFTGHDLGKGGKGAGTSGAGAAPQLSLGLAGDEPDKCARFLDAHFDAALKQGGSPGRLDDYFPMLDKKPATIPDIVKALMPLTTAGFSVLHGGQASGPLHEGTQAQLTKLVQERLMKLAWPKVTAAAAAIVTLPQGQQGPVTVPRAAVQAAVTDFLKQVMAAQKSKAVRITEPVRLAVGALTVGLPGLAAGVMLPTGITTGDPAQLAAQIVKPLPDPFPAANLAAFQRASPKEFAAPNMSASDVLAKVLSKEVNAVIGLLPKKWQDTVRDGVAGALASGLAAGLGKALEATPLDEKTRKAIEASVEAALKQKEHGPPMDRKADEAGSPDAPPPLPPPPEEPEGVVKPPPIIKAPPINLP